jgi:hypothetical protein
MRNVELGYASAGYAQAGIMQGKPNSLPYAFIDYNDRYGGTGYAKQTYVSASFVDGYVLKPKLLPTCTSVWYFCLDPQIRNAANTLILSASLPPLLDNLTTIQSEMFAGAKYITSDVPGLVTAPVVLNNLKYQQISSGAWSPIQCIYSSRIDNSKWSRTSSGCTSMTYWTNTE